MLTWNSLVLCHKNCASPVWQEPVVLWSGLYYFSVSVEVFESSWFPHLWKSCLMNFCWSDERKMCRCYNELFCDCWSLGSFFTCMLTMRLPSLASHHRTFSVWFSVGLWGVSLVTGDLANILQFTDLFHVLPSIFFTCFLFWSQTADIPCPLWFGGSCGCL